jgi:hypothetical protein
MKIEFTTRRLGVILAKAGIQNKKLNAWIPSFEGMTMDGKFLTIFYVNPMTKIQNLKI